MLGTFILGLVAGWAAPHASGRLGPAIESALPGDRPLSAVERAHAALAACLVAAAILSAIFDAPHALPLALGALVGVFVPRMIQARRDARTPDYDS